MSKVDEIAASSSHWRRGLAYKVLATYYISQMRAQASGYLTNQ